MGRAPFVEVVDLLGCRFRRNGKGTKGTERTLKKWLGSWRRDAHICQANSVPLVVSQVYRTRLNGSVNWPYGGQKSETPRLREREMRAKWKKMKLPTLMKALRSILRWRTTMDPMSVSRRKHQCDPGGSRGRLVPGEPGGRSAQEHCAAGCSRVTLSYVFPHCHRFPLEDCIWWVSLGHGDSGKNRKKQYNRWYAACGGQCNWRGANRVLVMQDGAIPSEATVFRAHAPPQGACENPVCALKLVATSWRGQLGGHVSRALQEQSRLKITNVGQPRGGEDGRCGEVHGGDQGGHAQLQRGDIP